MDKYYAEVIGDPVDHSKSPQIHRFWLDKLGIEGDYNAVHVRPHELGDYFASRRHQPQWRGCNITVPHKQAALPYLDGLGRLATEIGAVNMVIPHDGLTGLNSDVEGVVGSLPFVEGEVHTACLIGSGGAALAALGAFRLLGVARVMLNVRDRAKGERLLAHWGFDGRVGAVDDEANVHSAQLVINATTLGMEGQTAMPANLLAHIASHPDDETVVFDMVYAPLQTALLAAARQRGLRTVDGLAMLIGQAATAFGTFFDVPPPRELDAELRALLTS